MSCELTTFHNIWYKKMYNSCRLCFYHRMMIRSYSLSTKTVPAQTKIFDRETKRRQRNWSATQPDFDLCKFIRDEFGYRIADKMFDLLKNSPVCIDLGCGSGHISHHLSGGNIHCLIQCDMSEEMVKRNSKTTADTELFPILSAIADEELVTFRQGCADLILSNLSAHWINDLPGWFQRCFETLRPDGVLIGGMLAGETLHELRIALQLAEMERLGGLGAHISPFVQPQDVTSLMNRAGFQLCTIDIDEIVVNYPNLFALVHDLQLMAESNAGFNRSANLKREILVAADAIYKEMFSEKENCYPATFQMVNFIGWHPGANMPKPAKRGSQNVSFKDVSKFIEKGGIDKETPLESSKRPDPKGIKPTQ